jgi:hypothetical protein
MATPSKTKSPAAPRVGRFNRFQTAVSGVRYVPTSVDGHFDAYAEPLPRPQRSLQDMERIPRVEIPRN